MPVSGAGAKYSVDYEEIVYKTSSGERTRACTVRKDAPLHDFMRWLDDVNAARETAIALAPAGAASVLMVRHPRGKA